MAENVRDVAQRTRLPRYDAVLMAAFLRGSTAVEAAKAAGISERQAYRWKYRHGDRLAEARRNLLDAAQAQLREALPATAELVARGARDLGAVVPAALDRVREILANRDADLALVARVAQAVLAEARDQAALAFTIHAKLAEANELEARLGAIEERLAALASSTTPWGAPSFLATRPVERPAA